MNRHHRPHPIPQEWGLSENRRRSGIPQNTGQTHSVFYTINGNSIIRFYDNSRKEDVCSFLEAIRSHNPGKEIVLILDNFASHRSKVVKKRSLDLNIRLVYLPPYSPDLNPIEFLWKSIKRIVSRTLIASETHLKAVVENTFEEISMFNSYSMGWIRKFIPKEYNKYQKLGI